jgi:hypothetical protein
VIFRRRRPGRHAEDGDVFTEAPDVEPEDDEEALEEYVGGLSGDEVAPREGGPYDIADLPDDDHAERLDLGSLKIPKVSDVEIRMQANPQGEAFDVVLIADDSALQVGVFAAPRTDGIWDEVRAELRDSVTSEGGTVEEAAGRFGIELRARVRTPNGPADVRFVGVDGPRWFVRGLYQGRAAGDPAAGSSLDETLLGMVVERGKEARPVREPLPLTLPQEIADQVAAQQAAQGEDATVREASEDTGSEANGRRRDKRRTGRRR